MMQTEAMNQYMYINLTYLNTQTHGNKDLNCKMIQLYLDQTMPLLLVIKSSLNDSDWSSLYTAVHKMIPSFYIMGIENEYEELARKIQTIASTQLKVEGLPPMIAQLENICTKACEELQREYNLIKTSN